VGAYPAHWQRWLHGGCKPIGTAWGKGAGEGLEEEDGEE